MEAAPDVRGEVRRKKILGKNPGKAPNANIVLYLNVEESREIMGLIILCFA